MMDASFIKSILKNRFYVFFVETAKLLVSAKKKQKRLMRTILADLKKFFLDEVIFLYIIIKVFSAVYTPV